MLLLSTACEAIQHVTSQSRVFVQGCAATPFVLLEALVNNPFKLKNIELIHLHLEGKLPYQEKDFEKNFKVTNLFVGSNIRKQFNHSTMDYLPCFLSEIPQLFRKKIRPLDFALIHVSPPDEKGYCSLGTSVDIAKAAIETAPCIIAQINKNMPRVHGDGFIHIDEIDYAIEVNQPLVEEKTSKPNHAEQVIGKHIASLVSDGSTLQIGIGKIPNAALQCLTNHQNLGVHTEVWTDSLLPLIHQGVVNNSKKVIHQGKTLSSFIVGTKKLYQFIHDNPNVVQFDIAFTNNPYIIGKNPNVVAINSAVEVDLTGQVCADSIGTHIISGVGGQVDYIRGAHLSKNGKAIIAMTSRTGQGLPKIVNTLKKGAGVVTTRADVHYVITEYGIANLFGKTLHERAKALINIAHPEDRDELEKNWKNRLKNQ